MKVLELMHTLEEAYDRFGDANVIPDVDGHPYQTRIKDVTIESEEVILLIEDKN